MTSFNLESSSNLTISISTAGGRPKKNHNNRNWKRAANIKCSMIDCQNTLIYARKSGRCDECSHHKYDLLLTIYGDNLPTHNPTHSAIINSLLLLGNSPGNCLESIFNLLKKIIPGKIPDTSTITECYKDCQYKFENFKNLTTEIVSEVVSSKIFSNDQLDSSLTYKNANLSLRDTLIILTGLLICEEANRGNQWNFIQNKGEEGKQLFTQLGSLMPIAFYASRKFLMDVPTGKTIYR